MRRMIGIIAIGLVLLAGGAGRAFAAESAMTVESSDAPPVSWNLPKPPAETHADKPPVEAPDATGAVTSEDTGSVSVAGGGGTGYTNRMSFSYFSNGDMVVAGGRGSLTGHSGLFDRAYYTAILSSKAVWSANTTPLKGVQREYCSKYRSYDKAWALWVPNHQNHATEAVYYCRRHSGQPYDLSSSKSNQTRWYCSKLCWAAWRWTAGVDLDADGGYWVWPTDLVHDGQVRVFGFWD